MIQVAIIGCGSMGSAFAKGLSKKYDLILYDRNQDKREALARELNQKASSSLAEAIASASITILAIKPKDLPKIIENCTEVMRDKIVISLLTGVTLQKLKESFPGGEMVRIMPNLGVVCGQGLIAVVKDLEMSDPIQTQVSNLLAELGEVLFLDESKIDSFIALSGSGIGFVFLMIEAMMDGGVYLGFNAEQSKEIVLKTMQGACTLVGASHKHPAELKLQVASPGGTTIEGVKAMEEAGIRAGIFQALKACHEKAIRITKEMDEKRDEVSS